MNPRTLWTGLTLSPRAIPDEFQPDAALAVENGRIAWLGARTDLPPDWAGVPGTDLGGAWVTPALVDCHTHLVFGGNRADEFAQRLAGVSYEEIARRGGGIRSTVKATRALTEDELVAQALPRILAMAAEGVATVEIKSGYGLDLPSERRCLRAARRLGEETGLRVVTTFLGAHAVPPEFQDRQDAYLDLVCHQMLPTLAGEGLVDAVDAFCETIAFSPDQTERVFKAARDLGLPVKVHAEQLSLLGGAALGARWNALSADHLEWLDEAGVQALARSGTVAVLLPGAFFTLRETRVPPVDLLRRHGVPLAVATDCNPGTSPSASLLTTLHQACTLFRLTVPEVLAGATRHGARALGLADKTGVLSVGREADFAVWNVSSLAELAYWTGVPLCRMTVRGGQIVFQRSHP
ncbi:MAG TPA: imidazolonepropionase [Spirochaetia bacterium]|nr:imidazolonepropionase [Spirochaetia bacterium]